MFRKRPSLIWLASGFYWIRGVYDDSDAVDERCHSPLSVPSISMEAGGGIVR